MDDARIELTVCEERQVPELGLGRVRRRAPLAQGSRRTSDGQLVRPAPRERHADRLDDRPVLLEHQQTPSGYRAVQAHRRPDHFLDPLLPFTRGEEVHLVPAEVGEIAQTGRLPTRSQVV